MWIELRGGPLDGRVLQIPNDQRSVRFPMLQDDPFQMMMLAGDAAPMLTQQSWVEYGPVEAYNPYWSVWGYGP
jgi:hypothetical protein